jgi:hypothetical protein
VTQSAESDNPVRSLALSSDRLQVDGDADRRVLGDDTTSASLTARGGATVEITAGLIRLN